MSELPDTLTPTPPAALATALVPAIEAIGLTPTAELLAILLAQARLETGPLGEPGQMCRDWNLGNTKTGRDWTGDYCYYTKPPPHCKAPVTELLTLEQVAEAVRVAQPRPDGGGLDLMVGRTLTDGRRVCYFWARHPQTRFRAWASLEAGAVGWLEKLGGRYRDALMLAVGGDVAGYVRGIKARGYFTDELGPYLAKVRQHYETYLPVARAALQETTRSGASGSEIVDDSPEIGLPDQEQDIMSDRQQPSDTDVFLSDPADVLARDPVQMPYGEVSILWDTQHQCFARLGWDGTDRWTRAHGYRLPTWARAHGYRLPTRPELVELHAEAVARGHVVAPYPMPTREMCRADGIPYDSNTAVYRRYRDTRMRSTRWCGLHDAEVLRRCEAAKAPLTFCNSKHYHAASEEQQAGGWGMVGALQPGKGLGAYGHIPGWTSYALTALVVRVDPAGKRPSGPPEAPDPAADTDPAPPSKAAPDTLPGPDSWRPVLRRGMTGRDVMAWQHRLGSDGYGPGVRLSFAVVPDGDFGPKTEAATKAWQAARHLTPDGIVGPLTRSRIGADAMPEPEPATSKPWADVAVRGPGDHWLTFIRHVQAANYTHGPMPHRDWLCLHSTEGTYIRNGVLIPWVALGVARYFGGVNCVAPRASCHYVVGGDPRPEDGVVQCLDEIHGAWTAGVKVVNDRAIQIETVGRTLGTDWPSALMRPTLERAAAVAARSCRRWSIPVRLVGDEALAEARDLLRADPAAPLPEHCRGIIDHDDVTRCWHVQGGHRDVDYPGSRWDWDLTLRLISEAK